MTVWLVVLAVSPFTAPFSTWDLGLLTGTPMSLDLQSSDKKVQDDVTIDIAGHSSTPLLAGVFVRAVVQRGQVESLQVRQLVLRL